MFGKHGNKNMRQALRRREPEGAPCPLNRHKWIQTGSHFDPGMGYGDGEMA